MIEEILRRSNPWWAGEYQSPGIPRTAYHDEVNRLLKHEKIVILFGLRRVGKTTIMRQIIAERLKNTDPVRVLFASMDHPELEKTPIYEVLREFRRINGLKNKDSVVLFLDEVQSRPGFEKELKGIYDIEENVSIIASGSSSLIIKNNSSHLVGRYRSIRVNPLNFQEYLLFKGEKPDPAEPQLMEKYSDDYLRNGGIPQYVLNADPGYITDMVTNIIYRDISSTYGINEPKLLKDLYYLLMNRVGKKLSYSKVAKLMGIGDDAVKRYIGYFEEAYLLHILEQEGTPNEKKYGPKKCYAPDNGICSVVSGKTEMGALAENCVLLELSKTDEPKYYDRSGTEVDFISGNSAYEVKYKSELNEEDIDRFSLFQKKGVVKKWLITRSEQSDTEEIIKIPMWKFLLK